MEVEPKIAKQYKWQHCCSCKNYQGKGMEGGKKVSLHCFLADQKIASLWKKMLFEASCGTNNKLLLIARHIMTTGFKNAFKVGSVKFANSLSPPSIVKKVHTRSKSSQGT